MKKVLPLVVLLFLGCSAYHYNGSSMKHEVSFQMPQGWVDVRECEVDPATDAWLKRHNKILSAVYNPDLHAALVVSQRDFKDDFNKDKIVKLLYENHAKNLYATGVRNDLRQSENIAVNEIRWDGTESGKPVHRRSFMVSYKKYNGKTGLLMVVLNCEPDKLDDGLVAYNSVVQSVAIKTR